MSRNRVPPQLSPSANSPSPESSLLIDNIEQRRAITAQARRMVRAELMGSHTHATLCGVQVHVWHRGSKYLARGRYQGRPFGETLGDDLAEATARLRQLLTEIENGSYLRPSEARARPLAADRVPRLTLREVITAFLADRRKARGQRTAETYRSRLAPVLDFAEQMAARKRWPLAARIDHDFAVELRSFLVQHRTTRNGRAGGSLKPFSTTQVLNVLECLRTALAWARQARVRLLPPEWTSPFTTELIGERPRKDPLRQDPLPLEQRIRLVERMDRWQLCQLSLSVVLPLRPEEAAGLLISDVHFEKGWLEIGTRFDGGDFTKARTTFVLPFPDELRPILRACIGGRDAGPLLRARQVFEDRQRSRRVGSTEELGELFNERLAAGKGSVQNENDRKQVFRKLLRELGGVSEDRLAAECKTVLRTLGVSKGVSLYSLRSAVTTAMERANLPHLEMRYLTGHSVNDILNTYASLDPVRAMKTYFDTIRPLLEAILRRAEYLGVSVA